MMALGDILAARADNARARGTVDVGALGTVTVEALPVRELERLGRGADGDRAVFYAACRELQREGAALLRSGRLYRPDEVMALVSDAEAAKAAEAVRALSVPARTESDAGAGEAADTGASPARIGAGGDGAESETDGGTDENADGQALHESEIRPDAVQENAKVRREVVQKNAADAWTRPAVVRNKSEKNEEIRRRSVQTDAVRGQVSHEFLTENGEPLPNKSKTQVLPEKRSHKPQNVGVSDKMDSSLQKTERDIMAKNAAPKNRDGSGLHESKSEFGAECAEDLHEIKSEYGAERARDLHESKSEFGAEGEGDLHESKSEIGAERAGDLHETESELAERVARELLEGLRRAAWVR